MVSPKDKASNVKKIRSREHIQNNVC